MARLLLRDLRPNGQVHLTVGLSGGRSATIIQSARVVDDPAVWEHLDRLEADLAEKMDQAERALAV